MTVTASTHKRSLPRSASLCRVQSGVNDAMKKPATGTTNTIVKPQPKFTMVRFLFDGPLLPPVTETLPLAEQARRSLLSKCKYLARRREPSLADADIWPLSPAFWGKDDQG